MRASPCLALVLTGCLSFALVRADVSDSFHQVQSTLDDGMLDVLAGQPPAQDDRVEAALAMLAPWIKGGEAGDLLKAPMPSGASPAFKMGLARGRLQHVAALEMIRCQAAGDLVEAQAWRAVITLPEFAGGVDGALLLQSGDAAQARSPQVTAALAREYLEWQTMRVRQSLDFIQQQVTLHAASAAVIESNEAEVQALTAFPPSLAKAAQIGPLAAAPSTQIAWDDKADEKLQAAAVGAWREEIESTLPNLLSAKDASRLKRLLARFVKLVPREYANGVSDGKLLIPLEYREANQFADQAQTLVNQLAPVWKQEQPEAYARYHQDLTVQVGELHTLLARLASQHELEAQSQKVSSLLEDQFKIAARREGDSGDVIDETALEVRTSLGSSLAAAKADQWDKAEAARLDAYTAFDTEIEARVLPRDPDRAMQAERSFLAGDGTTAGIKVLLDQRAPMPELEAAYDRSLHSLDECMELLKVAVSPTTVALTGFSIVAREGLEAIVILAALLAGLRGVENAPIRRGIAGGAWMGIGVTVVTFWLSRTVIQSLSRFGEKLEAVVSVLAVIILLIVTNWVFHRFYWVGWNTKLRSLSKAAQGVRSTRWESFALLGVGFLTVYREGFEMALFLQSLLLEGGWMPVATGGAAALGCLALVGFLTFRYGMKLPYRKLLIITGVLVVSIMTTFLGSTVRLFQTVGWMPIHPIPHLSFPNWVGVWLGLYPSWEGILIPPLALVYVGSAWLWTRWQVKRTSVTTPPVSPPASSSKRLQPEHV